MIWVSRTFSGLLLYSLDGICMNVITHFTYRHTQKKNLHPLLTPVHKLYCTVLIYYISVQIYTVCYIYLLQQLHTELATNGKSIHSSDQTGSIISTLSANETAAAFLPASLFNLTQNGSKLGIYFNVYNSGVLFPVKNQTQSLGSNSSVTTVIGSPVLAATVGPMLNFSGLAEPVRILLRLNEELEVSSRNGCKKQLCASTHCYTLYRMPQIQDVSPGILILKVCTQQYVAITIMQLSYLSLHNIHRLDNRGM